MSERVKHTLLLKVQAVENKLWIINFAGWRQERKSDGRTFCFHFPGVCFRVSSSPLMLLKCRLVASKADCADPEPSPRSPSLSLCLLPAHFATSAASTQPQPAVFPRAGLLPRAWRALSACPTSPQGDNDLEKLIRLWPLRPEC